MMEEDNRNTLQETTELMIQQEAFKPNGDEKVETYVYDNLYDSKRKKNKFIPALLLLFVLIVVCLGGVYILALTNKKTIIRNDVSGLFNLLDKSFDEVKENSFPINFKEESIGFNGKVVFSSNYSDDEIDLSKLDKYNIEYNGAIDVKNNKLSFDAKLNKDNNALVTLNSFIKENIALIKSDELSLDTYKYQLSKEIKDLDLDSKYKIDDIDKLVSKTKEIVLNNVDDNKIEKTNYLEESDNTRINYVLVSYTFDVKELVNNTIHAYLADDEILDILSRLSNSDKDSVKDKLNDADLSSLEGYKLTINNYSTTLLGKFKKIDLVLSKDDKKARFTLTSVSDGYTYELVGNEEDNKITGKYNVNNKELTLNYEKDNVKVDASLKKVEKNYNLLLNFGKDDKKVKVEVKTTSNMTSNKKDDTIDINVTYSDEDIDDISFNVRFELTINKNVEVNEIVSDNVKDVTTLTESDLYLVKYKFSNIYTEIINDISNNKPYYNFNSYDYGYDNIEEFNL